MNLVIPAATAAAAEFAGETILDVEGGGLRWGGDVCEGLVGGLVRGVAWGGHFERDEM